MIVFNSSLSDINTNVNAKVPRLTLNGGFPVIAYSERNISGSTMLEVLENWIINAVTNHNYGNCVIIGYLYGTGFDGCAIVTLWGTSSEIKVINSASGIVISGSGVYRYHRPYNGTGKITQLSET